jgi:alpha-tubulin suppressor-like RCC1 family protein
VRLVIVAAVLPATLAVLLIMPSVAQASPRSATSNSTERADADLPGMNIVKAAQLAGTGKGSPPTVSGFAASPSKLYNDGGIVTLSATVTHAKSCLFSSTKPVTGLPATVPCTSGAVHQTVTLPANSGTKVVKYTFELAVTRITTVDAAPVKVKVGTSAPPAGLTGVRAIASDDIESYCALLTTGGVDCWGDNYFGTLGNGTTGGPDGSYGYDTPQVVTGITDAVSVTGEGDNGPGVGYGAGGYCAVLSTGAVDCWGYNGDGELGNGSTGGPDGRDGYDAPDAVSGITDAVSVIGDSNQGNGYGSSGYCAVLRTGKMECWGDNSVGELGNGTTGGPDLESNGLYGYDTPQAVTGLTNAISAASEGGGYCAVLSPGAMDCWGDNTFGELGNGATDGPDGEYGYDTPQGVSGITDAVSVTSNEGDSYCAVLSTGKMDCWGENNFGELGNGTINGPDEAYGYDTPQAVTGITDAVSVSSDEYGNGGSYCALLSTGRMDCWGDNTVDELGNGTTGGPDGGPNGGGYDTPEAVTGITDAVSASTDEDGYCAVLSTGAMDCWGDNIDGELGNGTTGGSDGGNFDDSPEAVSGMTDAVSAANGDLNGYCAVLSSSGADCWGQNSYGELGNGTINGPDGANGYDTPQSVSS